MNLLKKIGYTSAVLVAALGVSAQVTGSSNVGPITFSTQTPAARYVPIIGTKSVPGVALEVPVQAGDVVQVSATTQVTSPYTKNVMVGRFLEANGVKISHPMAMNVTSAIHHLPVSSDSVIEVEETGALLIEHRVYSAASWAKYCRTCKLRVDYAEMYVTVIPGG